MAVLLDKHGLRASRELWLNFARVVGNAGRSADLRRYMEWRIDNPRVCLGDDPGAANGLVRQLRLPAELWLSYAECVPQGDCSADLRTYIQWRNANPEAPLPGTARVSLDRYRDRVAA